MTPCIQWTGRRTHDGYAIREVGGRKDRRTIYLHRLAYEQAHGPIPDGYQIDHLCGNPGCLNPEHLEAVTPQENNRRSNSLSARRSRQTSCYRGHTLTGPNLYVWGGRRYCRACRAEYAVARRLSLAVKEVKP